LSCAPWTSRLRWPASGFSLSFSICHSSACHASSRAWPFSLRSATCDRIFEALLSSCVWAGDFPAQEIEQERCREVKRHTICDQKPVARALQTSSHPAERKMVNHDQHS